MTYDLNTPTWTIKNPFLKITFPVTAIAYYLVYAISIIFIFILYIYSHGGNITLDY
jgi:hypothetical protein